MGAGPSNPRQGFVVNENGDYFWLDRRHMGVIRRFAAAPLRPGGRGSRPHPGRLFSFPFTSFICCCMPWPFMFEGLLRRGEACSPFKVAM